MTLQRSASDQGNGFLWQELGLDIRTTPTYSPESSGMVEAFVKTFKRDYVTFGDLKDGRIIDVSIVPLDGRLYEAPPHKTLKMLSLREFIKQN